MTTETTTHRVTVTVRGIGRCEGAHGTAWARHDGTSWDEAEAETRATVRALRRAGESRCDSYQPDSGVPGRISALRSHRGREKGGSVWSATVLGMYIRTVEYIGEDSH